MLAIKNQLDSTVIDLLATFQELGVRLTYRAVHMRRLMSYSSPGGRNEGREWNRAISYAQILHLVLQISQNDGSENFSLLENEPLLILEYSISKNRERFDIMHCLYPLDFLDLNCLYGTLMCQLTIRSST